MPSEPRKPITPEARRNAYLLVINSLILLVIYYAAQNSGIPILASLVLIGYMVCFGGFLIAYVAYNRAFTRKGVTLDMLPDTWTEEQKLEYVEDGKRRAEKSKWMLSVIIPFLVTFIADVLYLFVWTGYLENFFT